MDLVCVLCRQFPGWTLYRFLSFLRLSPQHRFISLSSFSRKNYFTVRLCYSSRASRVVLWKAVSACLSQIRCSRCKGLKETQWLIELQPEFVEAFGVLDIDPLSPVLN